MTATIASKNESSPGSFNFLSLLLWIAVSLLGAGSLAFLAIGRAERVNAVWILSAALSTFAVAYRFYSKTIAERVFELNADAVTPAHKIDDGKDFVPTEKWILFGHHFAAIAGAGPWLAQSSLPSSAFFLGRSGSLLALFWLAPYKISFC